MMLTELNPDDQARIVAIEGGRGLRENLCHRGLTEGCRIRIINTVSGPVLVEARGAVIALGRGMAEKIRVVSIAD